MEPESIVKTLQVLALERDGWVQAPCWGVARAAGSLEGAGEPEAEGGPAVPSALGLGMAARLSQKPGGPVCRGEAGLGWS